MSEFPLVRYKIKVHGISRFLSVCAREGNNLSCHRNITSTEIRHMRRRSTYNCRSFLSYSRYDKSIK